MPLIENEFLSTFIHELLNSLNGVSSIARILQDSSTLDTEDIEESADDLAVLTNNANNLIGKLRAVINTKRVLSSELKVIQTLCKNHLPSKRQLPSSLSLTFEDNVKGNYVLPSLLFNVFFDWDRVKIVVGFYNDI